MNKASKLVGKSILGLDCRVVVVDSVAYTIMPPTIERIAGAACYLPDVEECSSMNDVLSQMKNMEKASAALAWFVCEPQKTKAEMLDEAARLAPILSKGGLDEVVAGLSVAYSLIDIGNFKRLSTLAWSVGRLTARPRPQETRVS